METGTSIGGMPIGLLQEGPEPPVKFITIVLLCRRSDVKSTQKAPRLARDWANTAPQSNQYLAAGLRLNVLDKLANIKQFAARLVRRTWSL